MQGSSKRLKSAAKASLFSRKRSRVRLRFSRRASYLKFKLGAAEVGPLLLPKVVRLNYEGDVDAGGKRLLQDLQQRLDAVPLGAAHIHDDGEAMFTHLLAGRDAGRRQWEEFKGRGRGAGEREKRSAMGKRETEGVGWREKRKRAHGGLKERRNVTHSL